MIYEIISIEITSLLKLINFHVLFAERDGPVARLAPGFSGFVSQRFCRFHVPGGIIVSYQSSPVPSPPDPRLLREVQENVSNSWDLIFYTCIFSVSYHVYSRVYTSDF